MFKEQINSHSFYQCATGAFGNLKSVHMWFKLGRASEALHFYWWAFADLSVLSTASCSPWELTAVKYFLFQTLQHSTKFLKSQRSLGEQAAGIMRTGLGLTHFERSHSWEKVTYSLSSTSSQRIQRADVTARTEFGHKWWIIPQHVPNNPKIVFFLYKNTM